MRATWSAPAGPSWPHELAALSARVVAAGRSVLIVVPDGRDVERVTTSVRALVDATVVLTADSGPHDRYASFLRVLSGAARVVVGTRAAAFAPLVDPGLFVAWDDGDDSLAEQRALYPHAREVFAVRSHLQECAAAGRVRAYRRGSNGGSTGVDRRDQRGRHDACGPAGRVLHRRSGPFPVRPGPASAPVGCGGPAHRLGGGSGAGAGRPPRIRAP